MRRSQDERLPRSCKFIRDPDDRGSIIDFVQNRRRLTLGQVRKELRAWAGAPTPAAASPSPSLRPKRIDRERVRREYEAAQQVPNSAYLNTRGLLPETLALDLFRGTFRVDSRGNVLFPHHDDAGLCGFETKNTGWTSFSTDGTKGLWQSNAPSEVATVVLTESAIDAISYHQINQPPATQYFSTGGTLSQAQGALLADRITSLSPSAQILLAFDRDKGGEQLAAAVRAHLPKANCQRAAPPDGKGKDWNDLLTG